MNVFCPSDDKRQKCHPHHEPISAPMQSHVECSRPLVAFGIAKDGHVEGIYKGK